MIASRTNLGKGHSFQLPKVRDEVLSAPQLTLEMRTRANGLTQVGPEGQAWPTRKSRSSKILVAIKSVAFVRCSAVECETRTLSQKLLFFVIKYETKKIGVARKICGLEKKITRSKICFSYEEVSSNRGRKFDQQRVREIPETGFGLLRSRPGDSIADKNQDYEILETNTRKLNRSENVKRRDISEYLTF